jgi:hypothetical protein
MSLEQYSTGRFVAQEFREQQARPYYKEYLAQLEQFKSDASRKNVFKKLMMSYSDYLM